MNLKESFLSQLRTSFPDLQSKLGDDLVSENLLSPFTVQLPWRLQQQARDIIESIFTMRETPQYQAHYQNLAQEKGLKDPGNKSIMMSYDFHVDADQNLKLIEVNTNASFLILGEQMYRMRQLPLSADFKLEDLKECILTELKLNGKILDRPPRVAIIDDQPSEQRLYVEFLAYAELFRSWGWEVKILDFKEALDGFQPDFIYNRHTDFFLEEPASQNLRAAFLQKQICFSPQPYEYLLLADKQRLIDWREEGFLEKMPITEEQRAHIRQATPLSYDLNQNNAAQIWSDRKKFFFKPKNAFGSKLSYRGGSISRKAFDEIVGKQTIAQEFITAPEIEYETPQGPQNFKYDLRCYAYQGRLQLIVARLYQGQVTNLRTPWGGFAPVLFS